MVSNQDLEEAIRFREGLKKAYRPLSDAPPDYTLEALLELKELRQREEWVKVSPESMPQPGQKVEILISDESVDIECWPTIGYRITGEEWWAGHPGKYINCRAEGWTVTHWRLLPAPPKEGLNG